MDSNNNSNSNNSTKSVASKLAEVSLAGPDSNNSNKGVESGDAGKVSAKPTDLETVPESETVNAHNDSHDKVSDSGKENTEKAQENVEANVTEKSPADDENEEINYEDTHPLEKPWTMWFMNGDTKNKNKAIIDNG